MKCDDCLHLAVCSYNQSVHDFIAKGGGPYRWTNNDKHAREAYEHLYHIYDNCKDYKILKEEEAKQWVLLKMQER